MIASLARPAAARRISRASLAAMGPGRGPITFKGPVEVAAMRAACDVVVAVHRRLRETIAPGVSTRELDALAYGVIKAHGGSPSFLGHQGYPASICASVNAVVVHGIPGDEALAAGDIISVDVGVELDGFHGDAAWTYAVGPVPEPVSRMMAGTRATLDAAVAVARDGTSLVDVARTVERVAAERGLGVVPDFGGHGIGRSMWEDPHVANKVEKAQSIRLRAGMAIAIEPMLTLGDPGYEIEADGWTMRTVDGSLAAHYEHTVVVTAEGGPLILTERLADMVE